MRLLPTFGRNRLRTATPAGAEAPEAAPPRPARAAVAGRSPSRSGRPHVHRMPEGHLTREDGGDGAPRWLRKSAGISWRILVIVAIAALAIWAMAKIQLVFIAVFLSLVVTAVLRPVVNFYGRVMPRGLATALAMLTGLFVVGGLLTYVVTSVTGQWDSLGRQFVEGIGSLADTISNLKLPFGIPTPSHEQIDQWTSPEQLEQLRQTAVTWLQHNQSNVISQVSSGAGSVFQVFATLALATFVTIFFLARGAEMWQWFVNQLPAKVRKSWIVGGEAGWYTFSGYARGTVIIALTDGILAGILLTVMGIPLALPLAVLVFIGAFIPLVGAPAAMVIAMVVALGTKGLIAAVVVGIGIALIGQFEGHILQPLIMGRQVSLHPVVVALAVTAGTLVAGILGAVIVIPIVAVIWAVFSKLRDNDAPLTQDDFREIHARLKAKRKAEDAAADAARKAERAARRGGEQAPAPS